MPEAINKKNISDLEEIKSDFITIASHQLRTPISAIRWSLDTLLDGRVGQLSEKQKEVVTEAYQSNRFMVKVVNDLLRIARLEEKGINLVPEYFDLVKLTKQIIARHKDFAAATNCALNLNIGTKVPKIYADILNMEMVIDSLVDNSILYSKAKGRIDVSIRRTNHHVLFKISDNGIGIPVKQHDKVFSKFFRAKNAMKAQTEGLGLDLYLARKIVETSGGKIDFQSTEMVGTTFNVYLPISKSQVENQEEEIKTKEFKVDETEENDTLKKEREFVAITVHELKAPLGISKWSLEMLKSQKPGKLSDDQLELIEQVYRGNERLLVLVRDLLNLSKLQEGKFEIEATKINFEKVIESIIKGFQVQASEKSLQFDWRGKTKKLPQVLADPNRIAQVATNLISNAVKYTPDKGKIIIDIEKKSKAELKKIDDVLSTANILFKDNKSGYLVFSVKDTGIGISEKDKNKLFSKFFRSKKVLKSQTEGTGLGLYITKSIVNLHKGDIWFTSELGKGSTFYFSLPIAS